MTDSPSHSGAAAPFPPRRVSLRDLIAYASLLSALLYLLFFHLAWDVFSRSEAGAWNQLENLQTEVARASVSQQNVEIHLEDSGPDASAYQIPFTRTYFAVAYLCYPKRVYVGSGDRIINFPEDIIKADHLPPPSWMHEHQVTGVYNVYGLEIVPHIRVTAVP